MARRSRRQITLEDPRSIRALTHPARIAVIDELYGGRIATSTELAELTGLTPSAMSYHLRAMEKLGLVERDRSTDGRERPWRAAGEGISLGRLTTRAQRAAGSALTATVLDAQHRAMERYGAAEPGLPAEWQSKHNFDSGVMHLTAAETRDLIDALMAATEPFRRRSARSRKNTRQVRVDVAVTPLVD